MKKRLLLLSLCILMIFTFGCGSNSTSDDVINAVELQNSTPVAEEVETVEEVVTYGDYNGYFWEIQSGDATVYLFGSIHMADKALYPMSEHVEKAFEASDVLGVEADISDIGAIQSTIPLMMYEGDETVYDHLSEEGIVKFEAICEELNLKPQLFQKFRVWAVGSNLMSLQLAKSPYSAEDGVDLYFINKAKEMAKEVVELEGVSMQLELINEFTDYEQEVTFLSTLGTTEETVADFEVMYNHYLSADVEQMTNFLFDPEAAAFEDNVEDKLLRDRNIGMADKIESYLQTDKTYFVVVGVAHYLGDESVIRYLEDKGYTINRK